jgi:hypothetical protein
MAESGIAGLTPPNVGRRRLPRRDSSGPLETVALEGGAHEAEEACTVFVATADGPLGFRRRVLVKRVNRSDDVAAVRALAREALSLSRVPGSHVQQLIDFFYDHEARPTLVLEYVDGLTLRQLIERCAARERYIPASLCAYVAERVFAALSIAHEARDPATGELATVVHGSLGLDSVLVGYDGRVVILDFTHARLVGDGAPADGARSVWTDDVRAGVRILRELLGATEAGPLPTPVLDVLGCGLQPEGQHVPFGARLYASALARVPCGRSTLRLFIQSLGKAVPVEDAAVAGSSDVASSPPPPPSVSSPPPSVTSQPVSFPTPAGGLECARLQPIPSRRGWPGRLSLVVGVAIVVALAAFTIRRATHARDAATAARVLHTLSARSPRPLVVLSGPQRARTPTTTFLVAPPALSEMRLTVDGNAVGNVGAIAEIPCGDHVLQVGATGRKQAISAPCGGELHLGR